MGEEEQSVQRVIHTRAMLDDMRNPPEYVEEKLPTRTFKLFARSKMGTLYDPEIHTNASPLNVGSMQFSGSHYDFAPGSYSLRIIRRSVYVGSTDRRNIQLEWRLRHSRIGTLDALPFLLGTYSTPRRDSKMNYEAFGNPMAPIYSFPAGTLWSYFVPGAGGRGSARVYSSLEGVF